MPRIFFSFVLVFYGAGVFRDADVFRSIAALFGSRRVIVIGLDGIAVRRSSGRAVSFGFLFVFSVEPRLRS